MERELARPDLLSNAAAPVKQLVLDAVASPHTKVMYAVALDDFFRWCFGAWQK